MEQNIYLLVIFAAILHAIWNGMVKSYKNKIISVSAIVFGHVPIAAFVMLFLPLPTLESVPYIILSALIHQGYQYNLISAYKIGDLTKVYPIARGTGPIRSTHHAAMPTPASPPSPSLYETTNGRSWFGKKTGRGGATLRFSIHQYKAERNWSFNAKRNGSCCRLLKARSMERPQRPKN